MAFEEIKTIQFKRGKKEILEARLVEGDLGVPAASEPIHEYDTGCLKIGDGVTPYKDLPYFNGEDSRFVIEDPLSGQVLLYDADLRKWVNKDLADTESIIYLTNRGLTIKGYDTATQGQMLVKDTTEGLTWVTPLDSSTLNQAILTAQQHATNAAGSAIEASNQAQAASTSATTARVINEQTLNHINEKFWWGTIEEYNEEISTNGLNPGSFYFVRPGA